MVVKKNGYVLKKKGEMVEAIIVIISIVLICLAVWILGNATDAFKWPTRSPADESSTTHTPHEEPRHIEQPENPYIGYIEDHYRLNDPRNHFRCLGAPLRISGDPKQELCLRSLAKLIRLLVQACLCGIMKPEIQRELRQTRSHRSSLEPASFYADMIISDMLDSIAENHERNETTVQSFLESRGHMFTKRGRAFEELRDLIQEILSFQENGLISEIDVSAVCDGLVVDDSIHGDSYRCIGMYVRYTNLTREQIIIAEKLQRFFDEVRPWYCELVNWLLVSMLHGKFRDMKRMLDVAIPCSVLESEISKEIMGMKKYMQGGPDGDVLNEIFLTPPIVDAAGELVSSLVKLACDSYNRLTLRSLISGLKGLLGTQCRGLNMSRSYESVGYIHSMELNSERLTKYIMQLNMYGDVTAFQGDGVILAINGSSDLSSDRPRIHGSIRRAGRHGETEYFTFVAELREWSISPMKFAIKTICRGNSCMNQDYGSISIYPNSYSISRFEIEYTSEKGSVHQLTIHSISSSYNLYQPPSALDFSTQSRRT